MRRLVIAFGQLASATLISQLIGFAVLALVARQIGASLLGDYGFASNLIGYFWLPVAGVGLVAVRELASGRQTPKEISGAFMLMLVLYSALVGVGVWLLADSVAPNPTAAAMLRIAALMQIASLLSLDWVLQAQGLFGRLSIARVAGQLVFGLIAVLLVASGREGLYRYAWCNVIGVVATLAVVWLCVVRNSGFPAVRPRLRASFTLLRASFPFTASVVMMTIYFTADFVLLGFLATSHDVGEYVIAYKIPAALLGLASAWVGVFFPHAAREAIQLLRRHIGKSTTASLIAFVPLAAASLVVGGPLIALLFGRQFTGAARPFELLMIAVLFGAIDANFGQVLLARGDQRHFAYNVTAGAVVNLALNFALIPLLGPAGSALATIAAEGLVLVLMMRRIRLTIGQPHVAWRRVRGAAVSSVVMICGLLLAGGWPVIPRIVLGVALFGAAALLTGTVRFADRRHAAGLVISG